MDGSRALHYYPWSIIHWESETGVAITLIEIIDAAATLIVHFLGGPSACGRFSPDPVPASRVMRSSTERQHGTIKSTGHLTPQCSESFGLRLAAINA